MTFKIFLGILILFTCAAWTLFAPAEFKTATYLFVYNSLGVVIPIGLGIAIILKGRSNG